VGIGPAQLLGGDFFAGGGLHQRRPRQKDRAGPADDDRLVAHRRDVRPARRATAEDNGHLAQPLGREERLVPEDPAKMLFVREDLAL
jgi:hypothetical protein